MTKKSLIFILGVGFLVGLVPLAWAGGNAHSFQETKAHVLSVIKRFEDICAHPNNRIDPRLCGLKWHQHKAILSQGGVAVKPFYREYQRKIFPRRFVRRFGFFIYQKKGFIEAARIRETLFEHEGNARVLTWVRVAYYKHGSKKASIVFAGPVDRQFTEAPNGWVEGGLGDNPSQNFYDSGIERVIRLIREFRQTMSDQGGYRTDYLLNRGTSVHVD